MNTVLLVLIIPLLIALAAAALLRANLLSRFGRRRPEREPDDASQGPATSAPAAGKPRALPGPRSLLSRASELGQRRQIRVGIAGLLCAAVFALVIGRVVAPPSQDDFVVLVAPFQEPDGSVTQTGRSAAERLVALLPQTTDGKVRAQLADAAPTDDSGIRDLLTRRGADLLIWGTITPGGMLDAETLVLAVGYQPTGAYAPLAWQGYNGRFALPLTYRLSGTPINGAVVLPRLLLALAHYGDDDPDTAYALLSRLQADYPALAPTLPSVLLGNLAWARGDTQAAADAYRRAISGIDPTAQPYQAALLYNNLGAALQDAGDLQARDAFNQAIMLLNAANADLGELRYNLAHASRIADDPASALASIAQARSLLPPSATLLLDQGELLRLNSQLRDPNGESNSKDDDAQSVLARVERQIPRDIDAAPVQLRQYYSDRIWARSARELALLQLAILTDLRGPLLWGLEARNDLDTAALGRAMSGLNDAVRLDQARVRRWSARAAAEDASGHPISGQIAAHQARLAERDLRASQFWQAAIQIEVGETQSVSPPQGLAGLWAGVRRESGELADARRTLEQLRVADSRNADLLLLLGYDELARRDRERATAHFNAADALRPNRPEPLYGLALTRLADQAEDEAQRRAAARDLLGQALERDSSFYPARIQLALLAEAELDWETAVAQRRILVEGQPSDATRLALGRTLRLSGRNGFAEAETVLLPIANKNNITALVELSEIYRDFGNVAAQRDVLERAQRIAPRNVGVAYDLGVLYQSDGSMAEAERQFQIALGVDGRHIPSLLAMADLNMKKPDVAADFYRRALDAGADDVSKLRAIGATMLEAGQGDLALKAFERAVKLSPDDPDSHYGLARSHLALGHLPEAQVEGDRALELRAGGFPAAQVLLGDVALGQNQPDAARARYEAALSAAPRLVEAHIGLGRAIAARGEWAVATGHFRNAVVIAPQMPEARLWLGEALIRQRDPVGALEQYEAALAVRQRYPEALFGAAQAQVALGQLDAAEERLLIAIDERPKYAEAFLLQGKLYELQGKQAELQGDANAQSARDRRALAAYEAAISANRQLPEPHYRRALLLIQADRLNDARGDLNAALELQPIFPEANYWVGRVDFAQGRYRESLERFQRAVEQAAGGYPEALYYQGLAEEQLGLRDAAIASFRATIGQRDAGAWAGEARAALTRLGVQ